MLSVANHPITLSRRRTLAALLAAVLLLLPITSTEATPVTVLAVTTTNTLVTFSSTAPGTLLSSRSITGLQSGETILGIDIRPATGQLIAVGNSSRVYVLNPQTGEATAVGTVFSPALSGTNFGVDFNPVPDRIRVVSDTGQNLRLNPATGAVAGTDLALGYAMGDANTGINPTVVAAAYSESFPRTLSGSTSTLTTLYVIDSGLDILARQGSPGGTSVSPNSGQLFTVGALGVDTTGTAAFDIALDGRAFAALRPSSATGASFYEINLGTGAATLIGAIGDGSQQIVGLALAPLARPQFDYDGDGRADLAIYRGTTGDWFILLSSTNSVRQVPFGAPSLNDIPVPGDYDGDGKTDVAVYRNNTGDWFILLSSTTNTVRQVPFGAPSLGDIPVPADYDRDGRTDVAVYRNTTGEWFIFRSSDGGITVTSFGAPSLGDVPLSMR